MNKHNDSQTSINKVAEMLYELADAVGMRKELVSRLYRIYGIDGLKREILATIDRDKSLLSRVCRENKELRKKYEASRQTDLTTGMYFAPKSDIHGEWRREYLRRFKNLEEI